MSSSSYTRGPYRKKNIPQEELKKIVSKPTKGFVRTYRSKIQYEDNLRKDAEPLYQELQEFKERIKTYPMSTNRSRILENIQGLKDCLIKQIRKDISEEKESLVKRLKEIEELEGNSAENSVIIPAGIDFDALDEYISNTQGGF